MTVPPASLSLLWGNLQEIYGAVSRTDTSELELISHNQEALSKRDSVFGVFSQIVASKDLTQPLTFTARLFEDLEVSWLKPHLEKYSEYLYALKDGCSESLTIPNEAKTHIEQWHQNTAPFLRLMDPEVMPPKMQDLLRTYFPHQKPFKEKFAEQTKHFVSMIRIENLSRTPLPLNDWLLISHYKEDGTRKERHQRWIARFIKHGLEKASPTMFFEGLEGVAYFFRSDRPFYNMSSCSIAYTLWSYGYKDFLTEPEPAQLAWREKLDEGDLLGKYKITQKIFEVPKERGKLVYKLDDERYVAKVFQNRMLPFLYVYSLSLFPPEIPIVKTIEVDPLGRFLIQERLEGPAVASNIKNISVIGTEERAALEPALKVMEYFRDNQWCPEIALTFFGFLPSGGMKALRPFIKTPLWLEPFEEYASAISKGNQIVYSYLMRAAKIQEIQAYKCYIAVVEEFALGLEDYLHPDVVAVHIGEHYESWKTNMEQLYKDIQKLRQSVRQQYIDRHQQILTDEILAQAIIKVYKSNQCISVLNKNAENDVMDSLEAAQS